MKTIAAQAPPAEHDDTIASIKSAFDETLHVASTALALLRAELRLARSSAFVLVWLSFALVFLGVGAWLATSAAIAAGIYQLTGNVFYGVGSVALANIVGMLGVVFAMRGCWRDLALPRTRRAMADLRETMS
jgi:lysylphosphatidylglycerol synthetase-like protein (DUF2156 family)